MTTRRVLRYCLLAIAILLVSTGLQAGHSQIEFTAILESVDMSSPDVDLLTMRLTPAFTVPVRVTAATEIKDRDDLPLAISDLMPGDTLKIEGLFTDSGILAREVEVTDAATDFELRGELEFVDPGDRTIGLLGFTIEVPATAEIKDEAGVSLSFSDLTVGQFVKVEGQVAGDSLVARQVRVAEARNPFARLRFSGRVTQIGTSSIRVQMEGGQEVLVEIGPQTSIRGTLFVGAQVRVIGVLTPALAVSAERIEVIELIQVVPDEVHLDFNQTHQVDVLLGQTFAEDLLLQLESRDPAVATTGSPGLNIPAGSLTGSFTIHSHALEGTTFIDVFLPAAAGGGRASVKVEVETDGPDDDPVPELVEVRWSPRRIETGGTGPRDVRLTLNRPAPENLQVALSLKEGPAGSVSFPSMVLIPQGERSVAVMIEIIQRVERAKVRARLPQSVGGDSDDLTIELRPEQTVRRDLRWSPDDLEMAPNSTRFVDLRLDAPAPFDFEVRITVERGDPGLVSGIPSRVEFQAGMESVRLQVSSLSSTGEVRFKAALPFELGGDEDDLKIEIE